MAKRKVKLKFGTRDLAKKKADVTLPRWDMGATGPANRLGLVTEERGHIDEKTGRKINPNGVKGVRRVDMLEAYKNQGRVSDRGYTAGSKLRDAWAATQRSQDVDLSAVRVDRTSKPDSAIDAQVARVSKLVGISKNVERGDRDILFSVVCEGRAISDLREYRGPDLEAGIVHLREALDRLADRLGV